jgi:hypothetical protein
MKKHLTLLLIACLVLPAVTLAQDIDLNEINITFKRLPLIPIDKTNRNYQVTVEQKDENKNAEIIAQNEADKAAAEQEFKDATAAYEAYQKRESEKTTGTKIAEHLLKNKEQAPPLPTRRNVPPPMLIELPDNAGLAGRINVAGFTKSSSNPITIKITLLGCEFANPNYSSFTNNGATNWSYSSSYKQPVQVKIEYNGKVFIDEVIPSTTSVTVFSNSEKSSSEYEAQQKFKASQKSYMQKSINTAIDKINEYLNSKIGFNPTKHESLLFSVKSKKVDYADYAAAYSDLNDGILMLGEDMLVADGKKKIASGVAKLDEIIKLYDPNDKKAKVNEDVAIATYFNYLEAYIWLDNYVEAQKMALKLKNSKLSNREERRLDRIKLFMADQKERFDANNS